MSDILLLNLKIEVGDLVVFIRFLIYESPNRICSVYYYYYYYCCCFCCCFFPPDISDGSQVLPTERSGVSPCVTQEVPSLWGLSSHNTESLTVDHCRKRPLKVLCFLNVKDIFHRFRKRIGTLQPLHSSLCYSHVIKSL